MVGAGLGMAADVALGVGVLVGGTGVGLEVGIVVLVGGIGVGLEVGIVVLVGGIGVGLGVAPQPVASIATATASINRTEKLGQHSLCFISISFFISPLLFLVGLLPSLCSGYRT